MNKQDWIMIILIIIAVSMGVIMTEDKPESVKYINLQSGGNSYRVLADSEYLCEAVEDGFYIVIDNVNGRKVIECVTDEVATASEWAESIRECFK